MLTILLLAYASTLFVMCRCPDTRMARSLQTHLVEMPIARISRMSRTDLLYVVIVAVLFTAGLDLVAILGPDFALVYAADLALYVDFLMVAVLVAATTRLKITAQSIQAVALQLWRRASRSARAKARQRESRTRTIAKRADNDSDRDSDRDRDEASFREAA